MNFKKYHVSKNLFDKYAEHTTGQTAYQYTISGLTPNQKYTCSTNFVAEAAKEASIYFNGGSTATNGVAYSSPKTFTCGSTGTMRLYVRFEGTSQSNPAIYDDLMNGTIWIMMNEGSTSLPYEPYSSEVWHDTPYYIRKTGTDTLTLPDVIYGDGTNATLTLKGNTVQNGTPSPSNPVDVVGCGERTANWFDIDNITHETLSSDGSITSANKMDLSALIAVNGNFTVSWNAVKNGAFMRVSTYDENKNFIERIAAINTYNYSNYTNTHTGYIRINYENDFQLSEVQVNTGSTALPYEPYGYKIPILNGSTTTPIYLGEVETTRKIKRYELTGLEDWRLSTSTPGVFWCNNFNNDYDNSLFDIVSAFCTHYKSVANNTGFASLPDRCMCLYCYIQTQTGYYELYIRDTSQGTLADFKAYLQQQYANGTPVTVWYVLATETTGTVNEPLMKIGDYTDGISGISLPTTDGANTISVGTTVQPSEVTANYHGWHTGAVHERESGSWD